jgi:uncharacterized protein
MTPQLEHKLQHLSSILGGFRSVLVAYSGGVDSALVMAVAHRALGERALACIGVSPSYPERERDEAIKLAEQVGARYRLFHPREQEDPNYAANPDNRCYFCKSALFDHLRTLAAEEGWGGIVDGNNADDVGDDRPGMTAARERGVRSPLLEAGLNKAEVRELARHFGLAAWDKPAMACLASRVPHGTPITAELLHQIETAEGVLVGLGFRQFRVRHHGELARVELPLADLLRAVEHQAAIVAGIRKAGYRHVTLDLAGFRGGAGEADVPTVSLTVAGMALE